MNSRTPFFDAACAKQALRRTAPLWLAHFVIWVLVMPVLMSNLIGHTSYIDYYILSTVHFGGPPMALFFCMMMSELLCNYLYAARSASFYHALPVRRSTLFRTNLLVGLGALLVPAALVGLLTLGVLAVQGVGGMAATVLRWLGAYACYCLFFTGFSLLCCHVTGHVGIGTLVYAILNFAAAAVELAVRYILSLFLFGVDIDFDVSLRALTPLIKIYEDSRIMRENGAAVYTGGGYRLALAAAGAVMVLLAWLLYRARRSEAAGEIISEPVLRPVFKYCMTAGFAFIVGVILYVLIYAVRDEQAAPSLIVFTLCMIAGGAVGYFTSEMMLKKSLRVSKRSLAGFAAAALVIVCGCCAVGFDVLGLETRVPEPEEIERVTVCCYGVAPFDTAELRAGDAQLAAVTELHRMAVRNRDADKALMNGVHSDENGSYYYNTNSVEIRYTLKDGTKMNRRYTLPLSRWYTKDAQDKWGGTFAEDSAYTAALEAVYGDADVIRRAFPMLWGEGQWFEPSIEVDGVDGSYRMMSARGTAAFTEALKADLLDGTVYGWNRATKNADEEIFDVHMSFTCLQSGGNMEYEYVNITVTPEASRCWAVLTDADNYLRASAYYDELDQQALADLAPMLFGDGKWRDFRAAAFGGAEYGSHALTDAGVDRLCAVLAPELASGTVGSWRGTSDDAWLRLELTATVSEDDGSEHTETCAFGVGESCRTWEVLHQAGNLAD